MKIAITGTRGVPNHYGGFEQFAEHLSEYLVRDGHEVTVYNSHTHPYQGAEWKGVKIRHCHDPEDKFGTIGQFFYDLNCILDCRRRDYDIILQLGYTSNSVWGFLLPKRSVIITNMDGMEWKRSKYKPIVQKFLRWAEKLAVKTSDFLISDSIGIQDYLLQKYKVRSQYIPYGASLFENPDIEVLQQYGVEKYAYDMLIARLEPENNIETILEGVTAAAGCSRTFLVVGNHNTAYGAYLKEKFGQHEKVRFIGGIYDMHKLNNLRYFSNIYFHGHSVGGTNPSLLEAMSSNTYICANKNIFNFSILGNDATYFTNAVEVRQLVETMEKNSEEARFKIFNNHRKIRTTYSWDDINGQYIRFMIDAYKEKNFAQKGVEVFSPRTFPSFGRLRKNAQPSEERLRQLEEENARLKSMYADLSLIHNTYKEAVTRSMS
jgi:glycosyltransferase involved in cell wall biosynthesis